MLTRLQAIKQAIGRSGLSQKEISDRTMMSESTLSRRLQNPADFTLSELDQLNKVLKFTDDEQMAIMKGGYDVWF